MAIISKNGQEWSRVAREMEATYYQWLEYSCVTETEFLGRLRKRPYWIEEQEFENGDREIHIYAGFRSVAEPLVYENGGNLTVEQFHDNVILILAMVAGRLGEELFENEVMRFAEKLGVAH